VSVEWNFGIDRGQTNRGSTSSHVELQNAGNHDDGLRPVSILEQRKPEGSRAINKQPAAEATLILNDPIALTVFADQEKRRYRMRLRRARFGLSHGELLLV
jgi:hypothetical protein